MSSLSISLSHQRPDFWRGQAAGQAVPPAPASPAAAAPARPWEWALPAGQAGRLRATGRARWLQVTAGRLWLTRSGAGPEGTDHWLASGDSLLLPAGSDWVAEASPAARAVLLEAPPVSAAPGAA
jgi:redox-sensitive bicupin YhaK (pirin superfamily)